MSNSKKDVIEIDDSSISDIPEEILKEIEEMERNLN